MEDKVTVIRCKYCKYYEKDVWIKVDSIPIIGAHHMCRKWGKGCQTDPEGYCFLGEEIKIE